MWQISHHQIQALKPSIWRGTNAHVYYLNWFSINKISHHTCAHAFWSAFSTVVPHDNTCNTPRSKFEQIGTDKSRQITTDDFAYIICELSVCPSEWLSQTGRTHPPTLIHRLDMQYTPPFMHMPGNGRHCHHCHHTHCIHRHLWQSGGVGTAALQETVLVWTFKSSHNLDCYNTYWYCIARCTFRRYVIPWECWLWLVHHNV